MTSKHYLSEAEKMSTDELIQKAMKQAKTLNVRFKLLEDTGKTSRSSAYRYAKDYSIKGKDDVPRYSEGKRYYQSKTRDELERIVAQQMQGLESETSTLRGLKKVTKRALTASQDALEDELPKAPTDKFSIDEETYKYFLEHGGGEMFTDYSSGTVYEDLTEYLKKYGDNETRVREFLSAYGRFVLKTGEKIGRGRPIKNKVSIQNGDMYTNNGKRIMYNEVKEKMFKKLPPKKIFKK